MNNNGINGERSRAPVKESNVLELWANKYPEVVTQWLPKVQIKAKNAYHLYRFCAWANKTPTELLKLKENPASKEAEKLLDAFVAADEKTLGMTNAVMVWCANAVKSFFKHNYSDLARASGAITNVKVKPYNKLSKDGLRKLWNRVYNPRDKALLTFVCSTAIAKETLSKIQWKHLEENWEKVELPCISLPAEILKGHGRGKYKGVKQITFLTPEAKRDLINYKEWLERQMSASGRKLTPEDHIFLETYAPYTPVSYGGLGSQMWFLSKRAGVPFSWHDARRWVNTALEQIGISLNWAHKIRGRKVKGEEAPYSQPAVEQLREKFREAVPLLEFTTETPALPKDVQDKLAALEAEQKRIKAEYGIYRERGRKPKTEHDGGDCANGSDTRSCANGHCQKIVSEQELPRLLADGWTFVATLPSGKVVVSNET